VATVGDILDRVTDLLEDKSTTTRSRLLPWVGVVLSELKLEGLVGPLTSNTITTIAGTDTYNLPTDLVTLHTVTLLDKGQDLTPLSRDAFVSLLAESSSIRGLPSRWTLWRPPTKALVGQLRLWPVPDAAYTLLLTYDADFSAITAESNVLEMDDATATAAIWGVYRIATRIEESPDVEAATGEWRLKVARAHLHSRGVDRVHRVKPDLP
jgi:hypothetical protein